MADETANPFTIDDSRLDREWLRQPKLMRAAGLREADARHELAQVSARLNVVSARLRTKIRADPGKYGLSAKPTKDAVDDALMLETEYKNALEDVIQAEYAVNIAKAETTAMVDRRKALERRVELIALDYYSEKEPRGSPAVREEMENRRRQSVRGNADDDA